MTKIIGSGDSMLDLLGDPVDMQPGKRKRHATAAIGSAAPKPQGFVDQLVAERTVFSDDRTHRFTLFRYWGDPDDYVCGINMNPSGAERSKVMQRSMPCAAAQRTCGVLGRIGN